MFVENNKMTYNKETSNRKKQNSIKTAISKIVAITLVLAITVGIVYFFPKVGVLLLEWYISVLEVASLLVNCIIDNMEKIQVIVESKDSMSIEIFDLLNIVYLLIITCPLCMLVKKAF